jgi:hypothetical protein
MGFGRFLSHVATPTHAPGGVFRSAMSGPGHKRTFRNIRSMSAIPPKADMETITQRVDLLACTDHDANAVRRERVRYCRLFY